MPIKRYVPHSDDGLASLTGICDICEKEIVKTVRKEDWLMSVGDFFLCDSCEMSLDNDTRAALKHRNSDDYGGYNYDDGESELPMGFHTYSIHDGFNKALEELQSYMVENSNEQPGVVEQSVQDRPLPNQQDRIGKVSPDSNRCAESDKTCY